MIIDANIWNVISLYRKEIQFIILKSDGQEIQIVEIYFFLDDGIMIYINDKLKQLKIFVLLQMIE